MGTANLTDSGSPIARRNRIQAIIQHFSDQARARRAELFKQSFTIDRHTRILDLGYGGQANIKAVLDGTSAQAGNVYIADIQEENVKRGAELHGYVPVVVDESGPLPFPDHFFDIVYCSSVIEHVTVPKEEVWSTFSGRKFRQRSHHRQRAFASEIARVGRQYFVQCPYKHFPLESHSMMPFFAWLPRWLLIPALRTTNRFWFKQTKPDWNLLNKRQLLALFDGSRLLKEKSFGLTKSIMAVRSADPEAGIGPDSEILPRDS